MFHMVMHADQMQRSISISAQYWFRGVKGLVEVVVLFHVARYLKIELQDASSKSKQENPLILDEFEHESKAN